MTIRRTLAALLAVPLVALAGPHPSMLVSTDWLAAHAGDQSLVILHVGSPKDYAEGHIPGGLLVTLGDLLTTGEGGLRLELPPPADLESTLGRLGITGSTRIVVYAGNGSVQSAMRVWFTLDYVGLGAQPRCSMAGSPGGEPSAVRSPPTGPASSWSGSLPIPRRKPPPPLSGSGIILHDPAVQVLDERLPEFYSGANAGGMPRAGHIPCARNVPFNSVFADDGTLKPPQSLRALFTPGRVPSVTVSYCHIGQQATVLYFVARYLGLPVRLYDGSFQDWSRRAELPLQTTPAGTTPLTPIDAIFSPLADRQSPRLAVLVRHRG